MGAFGFGAGLVLRRESIAAAMPGFDFADGTMPAGAMLTRASGGHCFGAGGTLTVVPADTPRFDHDPVSHRLRGLLIEPAATNIVVRSNAFDGAGWSSGDASVVATGPDWTITDASADYGYLSQGFTDRWPGGSACFSLVIRKDDVAKATRFVLARIGAGAVDLRIDTATGEVAAIGTGAPGVDDWGAYWRVHVALDAEGAIFLFPAAGRANGALAAASYAGDVAGACTIAGMQWEAGTVPTSPIISGDTPATRAADMLTLDWGSLGIADGTWPVRYRFDDGSYADEMTSITGGIAVVPTDLPRRHLLSARLR